MARSEKLRLRRADEDYSIEWDKRAMRLKLISERNSRGRWELQTPLGSLLLERGAGGSWRVMTLPGQPMDLNCDLEIWLRLTGLSELKVKTRRELVEITAETLRRYPRLPSTEWEKNN